MTDPLQNHEKSIFDAIVTKDRELAQGLLDDIDRERPNYYPGAIVRLDCHRLLALARFAEVGLFVTKCVTASFAPDNKAAE